MSQIKLVYQQIKEYIEKEASGKKTGDSLPSEVQYSLQFNVSRPTVRKAVDELIRAGIVRRVPGKGLLVGKREEATAQGKLLFAIPYIPGDGFFYNMLMGCIDAANTAGFGYKIIHLHSGEDRLRAIGECDLSTYLGVVLTAYENPHDRGILDLLNQADLPYILVDNPLEGVDCPYVITDDYGGGYLVGEHLVRNGHSSMLYLSLSGEIQTVRRRERGFRDALNDAGIDLSGVNFLYEENEADLPGLFDFVQQKYTAVCGYSDLRVIQAYNLLTSRGVKIPDDISLLGYGNFTYSELLPVPLTTISMPVFEMGWKAATMLADMIHTGKPGERVTLDIQLVERASVKNLTSL